MIDRIAGEVLRWIPVGLIPIANGAARMLLYQDLIGARAAGLVSAALDCLLIVLYARLLRTPRSVALRGATWLVCTTGLHFGLGRLAFGISWSDLVQKYDLLQGEAWLVVTLVVALSPWIATKLRRRSR